MIFSDGTMIAKTARSAAGDAEIIALIVKLNEIEARINVLADKITSNNSNIAILQSELSNDIPNRWALLQVNKAAGLISEGEYLAGVTAIQDRSDYLLLSITTKRTQGAEYLNKKGTLSAAFNKTEQALFTADAEFDRWADWATGWER